MLQLPTDEFERNYDRVKSWRSKHRAARLPSDWRCAWCGRVVIGSRRWVVLKHEILRQLKEWTDSRAEAVRQAGCLCRGCAMREPLRSLVWGV